MTVAYPGCGMRRPFPTHTHRILPGARTTFQADMMDMATRDRPSNAIEIAYRRNPLSASSTREIFEIWPSDKADD